MMRFGLGLTLLASSWLFGLDYFFHANQPLWATFVALGTLLICWSQLAASPSSPPAHQPTRSPASGQVIWSGMLALALVPAIVALPWPYRIAPVFLLCGLLFELGPYLNRWWRAIASGFSLSGLILLAQALALTVYKHGTARSHELPWPLPQLLAGVARLIGVDAAADGSDLVIATMRQNHHLGATWELLLDPATICFLAGGMAALLLGQCKEPDGRNVLPASRRQKRPAGGTPAVPLQVRQQTFTSMWRRLPASLRAAGLLLLAAMVWLPMRVAFAIGFYLHRALRTDYEAPINLMNQFWSPWPHFLLLLPLTLLAARWIRGVSIPAFAWGGWAALAEVRQWRRAAGLSAAAGIVITLAVFWDPIGQRKAGRIAVDEFHSRWEPTGRPFDTEWYGHLSGYNYACLYDFCSRFYEMSRLTNSLTDATLANLDVLILKVPTEPFLPAELDVISRFVERGGGLLLIGEHTDVFNTSYHLNQVSRRFGFTFRYDCLFGMNSFFDQFYQPPPVRHPALQNLRGFDFATSCSIDVGRSTGRGIIVSTGLKNSFADYHANNYYPQAVDHAAMRAGAFVQLWSARLGHGRVLAFTDSTIFSNFSFFEPGKADLMLGMLEWLNRSRSPGGNPRPLLLLLGLALGVLGMIDAFRQPQVRGVMLGGALLGWGATCLALAAYQARAVPAPQPVRPLTWVTIDRTLGDGPLSKGGFIAGKADGFGIFERWILRLGWFTRRLAGSQSLQGDLVVFLYPTKPMTEEYRQSLLRYVEAGGKVLVLDSPKNVTSTAGPLLQPFGLALKPLSIQNATLTGPAAWPAVPIDAAQEVSGGRALFHVNETPVGAVATYGKGTVVALGFGSRFSDAQMGVTGDVEPDANLRKVFDLEFALLRAILANKLFEP